MSKDQNLQKRQFEDIRLILRDLLKVIKIVSLYPEDNPLPQMLRRTFSERLVDIVDAYGTFEIRVSDKVLLFRDETIFTDRSKEESLAGIFFENGITRFSFLEGLDVADVYKLLDIIKDYQNSTDHSRDLAHLLWEAEVGRFSFETVEDIALAEYDGDFKIQEIFLPDSGNIDRNTLTGDRREAYDDLFLSRGTKHGTSGGQFEPDQDLEPGGGDYDAAAFGEDDGSMTYDRASGEADDGSSYVAGSGAVRLVSPGKDGQGKAEPRIRGAYARAPLPEDAGDRRIEGSVLDTGNELTDSEKKVAEAARAMGLSDLTGKAERLPDTTLILNDELKLSSEEEEEVERLAIYDAEFDCYESASELIKEMLHQEGELSDFSETVTISEKVLNELVQAGKLTYATEVLRYYRQLESQLQTGRPLWADRLKEARITVGSRDRLKALTDALNRNPELGNFELRSFLDLLGWEALLGITQMLGLIQHDLHRDTINDYLALRGRDNMQIVSAGIFDKRPDVVASSISILSRIGDDTALRQLKSLVKHKELPVRNVLVGALQDCPNDAALDLLKELARDEDASIRNQAVTSIVARRGPAAFEAISDVIADEHFGRLDFEDRRSILKAYSVLGSDMAVEYLVGLACRYNLFRDTTLAFYRQAAFDALSCNQGQKCEKALVRLSSSWRRDLRSQAALALKKRRELIYGGSDDQSSV